MSVPIKRCIELEFPVDLIGFSNQRTLTVVELELIKCTNKVEEHHLKV